MRNWICVEDHWMNFDYLTELWVMGNRVNQYVIMTQDSEGEVYELFNKVFDTRVDALNFLLKFMKENGLY